MSIEYSAYIETTGDYAIQIKLEVKNTWKFDVYVDILNRCGLVFLSLPTVLNSRVPIN